MTAKITPKFPERIWAIESGVPVHFRVSCSIIEHGPDEATEYVRADLYAALEAQLAEVKEQTEFWKASSEVADEYIAKMRTKISALEATPPAPNVTEALKAALTTMYRYQRAGCGDDVFCDDLSQSIRKAEAALTAAQCRVEWSEGERK